MTKRTELTITYGLLGVFTLLTFYPLFLAITVSLQNSSLLHSGLPWPTQFDFSNYVRAWKVGQFAQGFEHSFEIAGLVVPTSVGLSVLAGYAFGTMRFRGSRALMLLFVIGIVIPGEGKIIPLYWDLRGLGLTQNVFGVVLVQASGQLAFGVFWMRAFFASVPETVLEAARVDGASPFATLRLVLLPAARPAIGTLILLFFAESFNSFLIPLVLIQNPNYATVPLSFLKFAGHHQQADVTGLVAAGIIAALPVVVVFLIFQRSFVRGLLGTSVR